MYLVDDSSAQYSTLQHSPSAPCLVYRQNSAKGSLVLSGLGMLIAQSAHMVAQICNQ